MHKSILTATVDTDVLEVIRTMNINVSAEVNDFLKSRIGFIENLEESEKNETVLTTKLIELNNQIKFVSNELQRVKKEKETQKEKDITQRRLINSGKIMEF